MAGIFRIRNVLTLSRACTSISSKKLQPVSACRLLSTSDKKQDGAGVPSETKPPVSNLPDIPKTWVSWGFDESNFYRDRAIAHIILFSTICIGVSAFCYVLYYYPDMYGKEWARREAFLELRRREAAGLPLVDPNYVPPSQVKLPSDEEIGNYEIII